MNTQNKGLPKQAPASGEKKMQRNRKRRNRKKNSNNNNNNNSPGNSGFSVSTRNVPLANAAVVKNKRNDSKVLLKDSDYVINVTGTASFSLQRVISINPGLSGSFPMLSFTAKAYQMYRFSKLVVRYIPSCASTHAGSILIVPEFNINDAPPENWGAAANNSLSVQGQSFTGLTLSIPGSRMFNQGKHKIVRTGNVSDSKNLYDACTIYILTQNQVDTSEIGNIYLDYEVEFITRQTSLSYDPVPSRTNYYTYVGPTVNMVDGVAKVYPFNTLESAWNPLSIPTPVNGKFILPIGAYVLTATIGYTDNTSEFFNTDTYIRKNGSSVGASVPQSSGRESTLSYVSSTVCALVTSNGTDEFEIVGISSDTPSGLVYYTQETSYLLITVA